MPFNYLGPNTGPSTVANSLPSGVPGTLPAGIPGTGNVGSVTPTGSIQPSRPVIPQGPVPPGIASAIQRGPASGVPQQQQAPAEVGSPDAKYDIITQEDGTVVLFQQNPDGTRGPAVKIIKMGGKVGRPSAGQ